MQKLGSRGALFDIQAALYATHRPSYPQALWQAVWSFAAGGPAGSTAAAPPPDRRSLALDVGAGPGSQSTLELAANYERVIAIDSSPGQLQHAVQRPNIEYKLCAAERLREVVAPGSVDLISVGLALHWFDTQAFYAAARRALRPGGTLAIWGYTLAGFEQEHPAQTPEALRQASDALRRWCFGPPLGACWDPKRALLDARYPGMEPGADQFGTVVRQDVPGMEKVFSLDACIGYLSSYSNYTTYRTRHPEAEDPLVALRAELRRLLVAPAGGDDSAPVLRLCWPLFAILARDPVPLPPA